jgi:hypothetical protein
MTHDEFVQVKRAMAPSENPARAPIACTNEVVWSVRARLIVIDNVANEGCQPVLCLPRQGGRYSVLDTAGTIWAGGRMTQHAGTETSLSDMIESLPELVNGDAALVHRGRYVTDDLLIEVGTVPFYIAVASGQIASLERGPLLMRSWSFAIRGREEAWRQFWQAFPPPHYHDVFALAKRGEFRIEGDFRPLMRNLLYFKAVLAAPRRLAKEAR